MEQDIETFVANASAAEETNEDDEWGDVMNDEYDDEELDDLGFAEIKQPLVKAATERYAPIAINTGNKTHCRGHSMTPLRAFLQMSMLSSDTETEKEGEKEDEKDKKKKDVCIFASLPTSL
jgi:DNA helicase II / ATP-dependent DNA helicase PcrA